MNGGKLYEWFLDKIYHFAWQVGFGYHESNVARKGKYGEWLAKKYLNKKGFVFLEKNWRSRQNHRLEVDLIFQDLEILVFVEVRTRSSKSLVNGYDSINKKKRNSLRRAFMAYLRENSLPSLCYRFDVIEIDLPKTKEQKPAIFHHENIAIF